jgi:hypothetical protein
MQIAFHLMIVSLLFTCGERRCSVIQRIAAVMRIAVKPAKAGREMISANPSENIESESEKMKARRRDSILESLRRTVGEEGVTRLFFQKLILPEN